MGEDEKVQKAPRRFFTRLFKLSGKERWTVIVSLFCILLMISLSWFALSTVQKDRFTEFYILNDKGQAYDYPKNLTAGENSSLIIGLVNHEGRKTNYTVEFWLTNFTFLNMTVNVTHQYYVGGFNVVQIGRAHV